MPIPPPVKAVLRKEMLLGGGAGALLCGILVAAALSIGPLLGIGWPNGNGNGSATPEAVRLPAEPNTTPPAAEAEAARARAAAPRIVDAAAQPTQVVRPNGAARPQAAAPSVTARNHQPTTSARVVTPPATQDAPSVSAPDRERSSGSFG